MKDRFEREITYLRLSVTDLCNLRCRYCMPAEGVCKKRCEEMLSEDEMIAAIEAAAECGITKLRITGGEPLVKKNIISICERASAVKGIEEVCLTSNATLLADLAPALKRAGVSRINISLDTLNEKKYSYMTRTGSLRDALAGLDAALSAGFDRVKVNTVLIGGFNDDEIEDLASLTVKCPVDVRFIELMPMPGCEAFDEKAFISCDTVLTALPSLEPLPSKGGVARLYRLPGAPCSVGLISPVTSSFCGECNRIRLTADGMLKPCLHSRDEICIKGLGKDEMREKIKEAIASKPKSHVKLSGTDMSPAGRSMNRIGG